MNSLIEISLALSKVGLVNREDICIKDYGSTFACVCPSCMDMYQQRIKDFIGVNLKVKCDCCPNKHNK